MDACRRPPGTSRRQHNWPNRHGNNLIDKAKQSLRVLQLALTRAVRTYNPTLRGVAPGRRTAIDYGATRPVARNNSAAERARNRRVEVMVR